MPIPKNRHSDYFARSPRASARFGKDSLFSRDRESCYPEIDSDLDFEPFEEPRPDSGEVDENWELHLPDAFAKDAERATLALTVFRTEQRLRAVEAAITRNEQGSFVVPITTLVVQGLQLRKQVSALVRPDGDEFIASFIEANISISGDTVVEAVDNLKDIMAGIFKKFVRLPSAKLGPGPTSQLTVLREFIETPAQ